MKILHINSAKNWGGGEVHTLSLCQQLKNNNIEVYLACRKNSAIANKTKAAGITKINFALKGAIDFNSARKMAQFCRKNQIELIHAHLARDYWLAFWAKLMYPKLKLVFTRHLLLPIKTTWLHRWMFSKVDCVIAVSEAVRQVFAVNKLLSMQKIITIYNGIDINAFQFAESSQLREELNLASAQPIIGMVGQISPHKGQATFIESMPRILENFPACEFVIVGDDFADGSYIRELKDAAKKYGVLDKLHFLGPRNDIAKVMKAFTAFVLASDNEPFGLVLVEAMAAGIPVIATNAGGPSEIIKDNVTGVLFNPGRANDLAEAAIHVLKSPALAEKLAQSGQLHASKEYSLEHMADCTIRVYHQLLG